MKIADLRREPPKGKKGEVAIGGDGVPSIHLDDEHLKAMGYDGDDIPAAGQHLELHGSGHVVHASTSDNGKDGKSRSVHVKVTHLGASNRRGEERADGDLKGDIKKAVNGKK